MQGLEKEHEIVVSKQHFIHKNISELGSSAPTQKPNLPLGCDAFTSSAFLWGVISLKATSIFFNHSRPFHVPCKRSCFTQMHPKIEISTTTFWHCGWERNCSSPGQQKKSEERGCSIHHSRSRNMSRGSNRTATSSATALPVTTVMLPPYPVNTWLVVDKMILKAASQMVHNYWEEPPLEIKCSPKFSLATSPLSVDPRDK